jgi:hypothetical protein
MAYVPEDEAWNRKISTWMNTTRYCVRCGMHYRLIDNIGSWKCTQPMWDRNNEIWVHISADHGEPGRPYNTNNDVVLSACVMQYMRKRIHPSAILDKPVVGKNIRGTMQVFPAITVRRYDHMAWTRIYYGARQLDTEKEAYNKK